MRSLLQFLGVWGAMIGFSVGTFSIAVWALTFDDDPSDERIGTSMLWAIFWPFAWTYFSLTGKKPIANGRGTNSSSSKFELQVTSQGPSVPQFRTVREAKDYLAGLIAEEAERSGAPLTEVERKMLYFTETGWTLPDMKEISTEFDRHYDQDEYEQKIGSIITRIRARWVEKPEQERLAWNRALEKLSRGDHYLLVLDNAVNPARRGARHNLKILVIAIVFFILAALNLHFRHWLLDK